MISMMVKYNTSLDLTAKVDVHITSNRSITYMLNIAIIKEKLNQVIEKYQKKPFLPLLEMVSFLKN